MGGTPPAGFHRSPITGSAVRNMTSPAKNSLVVPARVRVTRASLMRRTSSASATLGTSGASTPYEIRAAPSSGDRVSANIAPSRPPSHQGR